MRKLIVWNLMTLDGYFEGTKPWDIDFHTLVWGPELQQYSERLGEEGDLLVFAARHMRAWPPIGRPPLTRKARKSRPI